MPGGSAGSPRRCHCPAAHLDLRGHGGARVATRGLGKHHDPQYVYAEISRALLPPGLLGLVVAALFAATMSVLSAGYNVIASVLTVDVYQRLINPAASQRRLVTVGKVLTVVVGACAMLVAWLVIYLKWTLFDTMVAAFGFFLPPTVLPVLAGLVWPRVTSRGALAGFIAGIVSGAAFLAAKPMIHGIDPHSMQTVVPMDFERGGGARDGARFAPDKRERARIAEFYASLGAACACHRGRRRSRTVLHFRAGVAVVGNRAGRHRLAHGHSQCPRIRRRTGARVSGRVTAGPPSSRGRNFMNRRTFLGTPAAAAAAPQTIVHGIPLEKLRAQYRADPAAPAVKTATSALTGSPARRSRHRLPGWRW